MKKAIVYIVLLAIMLFVPGAGSGSGLDTTGCIRLHVVANSDSAEDQNEKLLVRDAVTELLSDKLDGVDDPSRARMIVISFTGAIERAARATLDANGHPNREVRVTLGMEDFPSVEYGGEIVPAGKYTALRVTIGDGAGKNWWCMIFPPLCFAELHSDDPDYKAGQEDDSRIEIKWRLAEMFGGN